MPTDGADFQKRRPTQGRYFVAIKNNANSMELATIALESAAARIRQETMPMFRLMADLVIDLLTQRPLLSRSPNLFARALRNEMATIAEQFSELSMTREVSGILERVGVQLCAEGAILNPQDCRAKVFEGFFEGFLQVDLLDRARSSTMKHYELSGDSIARFEQRVVQQARSQGVKIMESVYDSPKGVPSSKRKQSGPKVEYTSEALHNEILSAVE
jgi:hypothetical protein